MSPNIEGVGYFASENLTGSSAPGSFPRYRKLKDFWGRRYGGRVQKVSLHAGFSCPNRDGTLGTGGCLYCSNEAFTPAYPHRGHALSRQIEEGLAFQTGRYPRAVGFLGYLQAYTNPHGPLEELVRIYETVLGHPRLAGPSTPCWRSGTSGRGCSLIRDLEAHTDEPVVRGTAFHRMNSFKTDGFDAI